VGEQPGRAVQMRRRRHRRRVGLAGVAIFGLGAGGEDELRL